MGRAVKPSVCAGTDKSSPPMEQEYEGPESWGTDEVIFDIASKSEPANETVDCASDTTGSPTWNCGLCWNSFS